MKVYLDRQRSEEIDVIELYDDSRFAQCEADIPDDQLAWGRAAEKAFNDWQDYLMDLYEDAMTRRGDKR